MKIPCDEIRESLSACLDGELPAEMTAVIETHLAHCPACRELAGELKAVSGLLQNLPRRKGPAGLSEEIVGRLERQVLLADLDEAQPLAPHVTDRGVSNRRPSLWPRMAAIAACVALAGGIALLQMVHSDSEAPPAMTDSYQTARADGWKTESDGSRYADLDGAEIAAGDSASPTYSVLPTAPAPALMGETAGSGGGVEASALQYHGNRLVIVTEAPVARSHAEINEVAREIDLPLEMTRQSIINEGGKQYLVSTYLNTRASGEQVAALNFNIANNLTFEVAEGTGLFATAPQSQQMARIAQDRAPELSQQVQREVTLRNLARTQHSQQFTRRLLGEDAPDSDARSMSGNELKDNDLLAAEAGKLALLAEQEGIATGARPGAVAESTDGRANVDGRAVGEVAAEPAPGQEVEVPEVQEFASAPDYDVEEQTRSTAAPGQPRPLTDNQRAMARQTPVSRGPTDDKPAAPAAAAERSDEVVPGRSTQSPARSETEAAGGAVATPAEPADVVKPVDVVAPDMFDRIMDERRRSARGVGSESGRIGTEGTALDEVRQDDTRDTNRDTSPPATDYGYTWRWAAEGLVYQRELLRLMLVNGLPLPCSLVAAQAAHGAESVRAGRFPENASMADALFLTVEIEVRNAIGPADQLLAP